MTEREKLIEIIRNSGYYLSTEDIADYLFDSGVVFTVKCAECRHRDKHDRNWCNYFMSAISPKAGFCYKGERHEQ